MSTNTNEKPILNEQKYTTTTYDNYGNEIIDPYKTDDQYRTVMTEDTARQQAFINSALKRQDESVKVSKTVGVSKNTPLGMLAKVGGNIMSAISKGMDAANKLPLPAKIAVMGAAGAFTLATLPVSGTVAGVMAVGSGVVGGASIVFSKDIGKVAKGAGTTVTNVTHNKVLGGAVEFGINLAPGLLSGGLGAAAKAGTVAQLAATAASEGALMSADDVVKAGVSTIANSADDVAKAVGSGVVNSGDDVARLVGASDALKDTAVNLTNATTNTGINTATEAVLTANKDVANAMANAGGSVTTNATNVITNATNTISKEGTKIANITSNAVTGNVRSGSNVADDAVRMFNEFGKANISGFTPANNIDEAIEFAKNYSSSGAFKSGFVNNGDKVVKALQKSKEAIAGSNKSFLQTIVGAKAEFVKAAGRKIPIIGKNLRAFAPKNMAVLNNNVDLGRTLDLMSKNGNIISQYTKLGALNSMFPKSNVVNTASRLLGTFAKPLGDTVRESAVVSTWAANAGKLGTVFKAGAGVVNVGKYLAPNIDLAQSALFGFSESERRKLHEVLTDKAYTPEMREEYLTKIFQDPTKLIVPTSFVKTNGFDNYIYTDAYGFVDVANNRMVNTELLFREVYGDKYTMDDVKVDMDNLFNGYSDTYSEKVDETREDAFNTINNRNSTDYEGYDAFKESVDNVDIPDIEYSKSNDEGFGY